MKKITKILAALLLIFVFAFNIVSCNTPSNQETPNTNESADESFYIDSTSPLNIKVGDSVTFKVVKSDNLDGDITWTSSSSCASVDNGVVTALKEGTAVIRAHLGEHVDRVIINVLPLDSDHNDSNHDKEDEKEDDYVFGSEYPCITIEEAIIKAEEFTNAPSTDTYYIVARVNSILDGKTGEMFIEDDTGSIYVYKCNDINGSAISATDLAVGGTLRNYKGMPEIERGQIIDFYTPGIDTPTKPDDSGNDNEDNNGGEDVIIPGTGDPITSDPYTNVDKDEFYENYTPATSYMDAYYRTKHNLMSGTIGSQDQAPTTSSYQPKSNGKFIRNNVYLFSEDGNTYFVVDAYGEIAFEVYRGGAYVMLDEVAAYVFAFGEPPANHSYSKNTTPAQSVWGEYLRVNNTKFSGDTSRYPYEPMLPRISGCGGDLTYYEMDIGTTGTDCDPSYTAKIYNNGKSITRGAARIVYSCYDRNGNKIIDLDERYVFYTYNHYNDFQEYLNYSGGWGEIFGNITGGGTISSKYDYNPTDYVEVVRASLNQGTAAVIIYAYFPKEEYAA